MRQTILLSLLVKLSALMIIGCGSSETTHAPEPDRGDDPERQAEASKPQPKPGDPQREAENAPQGSEVEPEPQSGEVGGENEQPTSPALTSEPDLRSLDGRWAGACVNDLASTASEQGTIEFRGGSMLLSVRIHNDLDCKPAELESTFVMKGEYGDGTPSAKLAGARNITYTVGTIELMVHGPTVDTANRRRFCGLKGWQSGVAKEVTGLKCPRLDLDNPARGAQMFDIFQVEGAKLRLGLSRTASGVELNGSTPAKRPETLAEAVFSRR